MHDTLRQAIERKIIHRLIRDAIAAGYQVSVYDGGEITVSRSVVLKDIMSAVMTTDDDVLQFYLPDQGTRVGTVHLVYGWDGWDVIADCSANPAMESLLAGANTVALKLETRYG